MIHLGADSADLARLTDDLLDRHSDVEALRERLSHGRTHDPAVWARLVGSGLVGALAGEELGGTGLLPGHVARVLESMGRHVLPEPYLETAIIGVPLLAAFPGSPQAQGTLARVLDGEALVAVRLGSLTPHVVHATDADVLLDVTGDGTVTAYAGPGLDVVPLNGIDPLRPVGRVVLGEGVVLGRSPGAADRARVLAVAGSACLLAGVLQALVATTVEYVGVREQFGRPVGSFQAVKHRAATMAVLAEMSSAAALTALEDVDAPDAFVRAAAAKAYASAAAETVNVDSLQLHGGIGFTWEHHLHLWLKRAMSLAASYGTARDLRRTLASGALTALPVGAVR